MKFKVFNSNFQNAVNVLGSYGWTMQNEDVVDLLWTKVNNAELAIFMDSIKADYCSNRQKYTGILQKIATQIPTGKIPLFTKAGVSGLKTGGTNIHNTSAWPAEGEIFPDSTLYTGSYPYDQWVSSAVTPNSDKICASREEGWGEHKSNNYKKGRQQKRKVAKNPLPNIGTGVNQVTIYFRACNQKRYCKTHRRVKWIASRHLIWLTIWEGQQMTVLLYTIV